MRHLRRYVVGVMSSGGRIRETWQWDNIDSGDVDLEITFDRSEAMNTLRKARAALKKNANEEVGARTGRGATASW